MIIQVVVRKEESIPAFFFALSLTGMEAPVQVPSLALRPP